jgi:DNA-binding Xre family transcriptional regulator
MVMRSEENRMITSNLKAIMSEKKVTIRRMVAETGLSNMTILKARRAEITQCRLCTLAAIAAYLGVKTKDLYSEE